MRFQDLQPAVNTYYVIMKNGQPLVHHRDLDHATQLMQELTHQFPQDQFRAEARHGMLEQDRYRCAECGGHALESQHDLEEAKKDACYYKVRSRYKVWPSAYASGALVQCRKKGAANWGNKAKTESLSTAADPVVEQSDLDEIATGTSEPTATHFWVKDTMNNYHGPYRSEYAARRSVPFSEHPGARIMELPVTVRNPRTLTPSLTRMINARVAGGAIKEEEPRTQDRFGISDPEGKFHPMNIEMLVGAFLRTHRMTPDLQDNLKQHIGQWLVKHRRELDGMGYQDADHARLMMLMQEMMDVDAVFEGEDLDENLRKWFREKWVRFGPDGKIRGDCARGSSREGKPKCLPQSKAHSLGKKGRASAAARKRRQDPDADRRGAAKNVATKKESVAEADDALDPRPTVLPPKSELILFVNGTEVAVYNSMSDAVADARRFAKRYPNYDIVLKRDVCTRANVARIQEGRTLGDLS